MIVRSLKMASRLPGCTGDCVSCQIWRCTQICVIAREAYVEENYKV